MALIGARFALPVQFAFHLTLGLGAAMAGPL